MKEIRFACGYPCYIILNAHRSSVMNKITPGNIFDTLNLENSRVNCSFWVKVQSILEY